MTQDHNDSQMMRQGHAPDKDDLMLMDVFKDIFVSRA
jgi:hypothetical protein